ncbi:MAG TPA: hypothetical protein VF623_11510 [Segetibacter sp.]
MKLACFAIITLALLASASKTYCQQDEKVVDSIEKKIAGYALQKPSSLLFVHFDKNVYTNNESVWFTAYLLESNTKAAHKVLSVALIRDDDRSVLAEGKFVINKSLAFGNLYLPDSLPTGSYSFVCYTNQLINNYPSALFIQPVTIKTANAASFIANLSLLDSIKPNMDSARVLLQAYTTDVTLVRGAEVTYFIGDRTNPLKTGKLKTDKFGEAKISIPLKLITPANNMLQAEINNGKEIKTFSIKLPVSKKETVVKFYPEGGNLINGTKNTVGWEVTNNEGEPVMANGVLYADNKALKTIQTNAYGMGKFNFTPINNVHYFVKLNNAENPTDTVYLLPAILPNGPVINISNALTTDTLSIQLNNLQAGAKWIIMVHNYRATFVTDLIGSKGSVMMLKIPLDEVPKGLATFTLFDTLGRPWAERLFFAHFDRKAVVNISTDSTSYSARQKVSVKFKVTDGVQNPLRSLFSVACVQENRLDVKKMTDIESYTYLRSELASLTFKNKLLGNQADNIAFLEDVLLVKGWRRYKWQDVEALKATDTIQPTASLNVTGITTLNSKALKKPVQLFIAKFITTKMSGIELLDTDSSGRFELTNEKLESEGNKALQITVNNKNKQEYTIKVNDAYKEMNKKLAASLLFNHYNISSFSQTSQGVVLKKEEGAKRLLDVKVTAKKDVSIFGTRGPNACGDYVCSFGVLNCPNHPFDGYEPVLGQTYTVKSAGGGSVVGKVIYTGCQDLLQENKKEYQAKIDGIYTKKEFYVADFSKSDASDPQYLSTIYWNHSLLTNDNGEADVTFYTSDISGRFKIVVQGITDKDVVYGEKVFDVRKQ